MRVIEKFVCDKCGREYYDKLSTEKCELTHKTGFVLGSYLTHLAKIAPSIQIAIEHVVSCNWCKSDIKEGERLEEVDMFLRRVSDAMKRE